MADRYFSFDGETYQTNKIATGGLHPDDLDARLRLIESRLGGHDAQLDALAGLRAAPKPVAVDESVDLAAIRARLDAVGTLGDRRPVVNDVYDHGLIIFDTVEGADDNARFDAANRGTSTAGLYVVASVVSYGKMTGCTVAALDDLLEHAIPDLRALLAEVEALRVRVATLSTNTKENR